MTCPGLSKIVRRRMVTKESSVPNVLASRRNIRVIISQNQARTRRNWVRMSNCNCNCNCITLLPYHGTVHTTKLGSKLSSSSPFNRSSLEGGGGWGQIDPHSMFLALNFCSLTDCQKLWHNCSLFVNTSFDINYVRS